MIYSDLSFTLGHKRVEEYINSLPIENNMKEKMYQDLMKHSVGVRSEKVNKIILSSSFLYIYKKTK